MTERAQALTVEGTLAAILVLTSLAVAVQLAAVTAPEPRTANHPESQHRAVGETVLSTADEAGTLQSTLRFWNPDRGPNGAFDGAPIDENGAYTDGVPTTADHENVSPTEHTDVLEFGQLLTRSLADRELSYNLRVRYPDQGTLSSQRVVYQGEPTGDAVTATRTVTFYEHDRLYTDQHDPNATLERTNFYADSEATTSVYTVLEVELVIWQR